MKYKKLLTLATITGLAIGGLTIANAASAQSYGGGDTTESTVETDTPTEGDSSVEGDASTDTEGEVVLVQETPAEDAETEADEADGERRGRHRGACNLEAAAEAIGIEEADLKAALESGDTIADVAAANGVDTQVVIDAMVDSKADRIEAKVESGRITAEEAAEKLAELEARTADRVNGVEDAPGA
jgi:hypothetical protein